MVESYSPTSITISIDQYLWDKWQVQDAEYRFAFVESTLTPTLFIYFSSKITGDKEALITVTNYSEYNKISPNAKSEIDKQVGLLKLLGVV